MKTSESHSARMRLFQRGIREGRLTIEEVEQTLSSEPFSDEDRWLLYYSLRAAGVEIRPGSDGAAREG